MQINQGKGLPQTKIDVRKSNISQKQIEFEKFPIQKFKTEFYNQLFFIIIKKNIKFFKQKMFIEAFIAILIIGALKLVIIPYFKFLKYKKYGKGRFVPFIGELSEIKEAIQKHEDVDYFVSHQCDEDPDLKLFVVNLGSKIKLRLVDPDLMREFFLNQQYYVKDTFYIGNVLRCAPYGIAFVEGEQWKKSRKLFSQAFHFEYLTSLAPLIEQIAQKVFNSVIENSECLANYDPLVYSQKITGQVIIATFFGEEINNTKFRGMDLVSALTHMLNLLGEQSMTLQYFLFGADFFKLRLTKSQRYVDDIIKDFRSFMKQLIEGKIESIQQELKEQGKVSFPSILAQIVSSQQITPDQKKYLFDDFTTLYAAGTDTTGHLLAMTLYYITQNPHLQKVLQKEVDENKDQTPQGLAQLTYLNGFLKETLRYYGPANFTFDRIATQDHYLGDIPIQKGTIVVPISQSTHRNKKYYEDPHRYNPERWLDNKQKQLHNYAFMSFGAGQRNCIGQHLAMIVARITLNKFVKMFEFSCDPNYKLVMTQRFMSEPLDPIPLRLTVRKN
ncbi:hypothetical protein ABPG74_001157 [Tetrahymena malaccensis]